MKKLVSVIILLMIIISINFFYTSEAIKLVDDEYLKAGIFNELLENKNVVAISPSKLFKATATNEDDMYILLKQDLDNIFEKSNLLISNIKNKNGKIYDNKTAISTGAIATTTDGKEYSIVLYGDANGDGRICNSMDIDVIRQDYVYNNKAKSEYKIAADLQADNVLNVRDVQRMIKKYLGNLDTTVVAPFPEEKVFNLNPSDDFELLREEEQIIVSDSKVEWSWDQESNVAQIEVQEDGTLKIVGKNEGNIEITAKDENGNEKSLNISVICPKIEIFDYTTTTIKVKVTLEGREIDTIEHFYKHPNGYTKDENLEKSAGKTTNEEFTYTTEILNIDEPYQLSAEITTKDGKKSRTDEVSWLMGSAGTAPTIEITTEPKENTVIIKTHVINLEDVIKYSDIKDYTYEIKKSNGTSYETIEGGIITTENPECVFERLEDGNYIAIVTAITKKGVTSKSIQKQFDIITKEEPPIEQPVDPQVNVNVKTYNNTATVTTKIINTDKLIGKLLPYEHILKKEGVAKSSKITTENEKYTFNNLEDGNYLLTTIVKTDKNETATITKKFTINTLEEGETRDESLSVAKVKSTNKMYTSVQYAVNSVTNNDTVILMKDVIESVTIPANKTNLTVDLAGYNFTAAEEKFVLEIFGTVNLVNTQEDTESQLVGLVEAENSTAISMAENNSKVNIGKGIELKTIKNQNAIETVARKTGIEITIDGANWSSGVSLSLLVKDNGEATINIYSGNFSGYTGLIEQLNGRGIINIGKKDDEISTTNPYITCRDTWFSTNKINENSTINFYNGKLECRSGLNEFKKNIVDGVRNDAFLFVNQLGSEAYYIPLREDETLNKEEAVAELLPEGSLYKTIHSAVNVAKNNNTIKILKDIDESTLVVIEKNININLNGKTIKTPFNIIGNVELIDKSTNPGKIDLSNDANRAAISVTETGSVTLKDGVNISAYKYAVECISSDAKINIIEANISENMPSDIILDDSNRTNSAIRIDNGTINIGTKTEKGKVNISGERYGIYATGTSTIYINNSEEKNNDDYTYEIYGNIASIYNSCAEIKEAKMEIDGGRFITEPLIDRGVISLTGNIVFTTKGGIIGGTECGFGIKASHIDLVDNMQVIPKLELNGSTKVYGRQALYIGRSGFNIPNAEINLKIGTDDYGQNDDGVKIVGAASGIYLGSRGEKNIILGKQDTNSIDGKLTENKTPVIRTINDGYAIDLVNNVNDKLEINCNAIILSFNQYINAIDGIREDQISTTSGKEIAFNEIIEILGTKFKGVYLKE